VGAGAATAPEPERVQPKPSSEPHDGRPDERPDQPARVFAGRRSIASASRDEVIGGVLLLVVAAWAVQALFADADYSNPFEDGTAGDLRTILLTAALLLPFVVFFYGGNVHAVTAGTAIGYVAYAGMPSYYWWRYDSSDTGFPIKIVVMTVLLAAAWFMFRRGSPVARAWIEHKPSRYLQIAAAVATLVATLLYLNQLSDNDSDYRIHVVYLVVAVFTAVLSVRRSLGATIALTALAAETTLFYLTSAIDDSYHRDRLQNVAVAAAVLTGSALWRTRRAVRVDTEK
jgi:hypothetical protein